MTPTVRSSQPTVRAEQSAEIVKRKAEQVRSAAEAKKAVVPDYKNVKTAPDAGTTTKSGSAPSTRSKKDLEQIGQGAGNAAMDRIKADDMKTAASVLCHLPDEPAAKAAAMKVLKWTKLSDIILASPPDVRAELITKFGNAFTAEERKNLAVCLAAKGDCTSAAYVIGQAGKNAPAIIDEVLKLGGVTYDRLFAGAKDDGAAVQALSRHYCAKRIATNETAFARDLKFALGEPWVKALAPKVSRDDLDYMIATGDMPPKVEAFIADALASKDPAKLAVAEKLLNMRELALADRFAAQIPFEMDDNTRAKWKSEWAAHEKLSDKLAAAQGKWVDTKNTTIADMVFDAIAHKDSKKAFASLDPRGRDLFVRLTAKTYVPDTNNMGERPFGARTVGELAFSQWDPTDQRDLAHFAKLGSEYAGEQTREFNEPFVREAMRGGDFTRELSAIAKDNADPKVKAWARRILDEANARTASKPTVTEKTRKIFADAKLDPTSKDFAKKAADCLLSDAFKTPEARAQAIACFEATYGMSFGELVANADPARAEKLTVTYGAVLDGAQSRAVIDALAGKGKDYDDAIHGLIYSKRKDKAAQEGLIDRALYRGIESERLMKSASDSRWDRDNYRPALKKYLEKNPYA